MLVMNVLTQHNPLYQVELWAESLPLPILWGDAITAHQFNDDALGCVLGGSLLSGNTSDRTWHPQRLDQLDSDYPEDFWQGSYYIADSALMTEPALTKIGALGMYWLGRLPATFGLCD